MLNSWDDVVAFALTNAGRIRRVIARAWWDKAGKAQRRAFGERP